MRRLLVLSNEVTYMVEQPKKTTTEKTVEKPVEKTVEKTVKEE